MGSRFRESSCSKLHMLKSHVHHWSKLDSSCSSYMSVEGNLVVLLYTVEVCVWLCWQWIIVHLVLSMWLNRTQTKNMMLSTFQLNWQPCNCQRCDAYGCVNCWSTIHTCWQSKDLTCRRESHMQMRMVCFSWKPLQRLHKMLTSFSMKLVCFINRSLNSLPCERNHCNVFL